jgi:hypothetical protein
MSAIPSSNRRTVRTFTYLRGVSWFAYENAKKAEKGRFNNLITAMVFSAFCLEAFLNHVGPDKVPGWKLIKRDPYKKLDDVSRSINLIVDKTTRPFSSFKEIFEFRNNLAHAQTEVLDTEYILVNPESDDTKEPLSKWEAKITMTDAGRFLDDTKAIIYEIADAAGYDRKTILNFERPKRIISDLGGSSMASS